MKNRLLIMDDQPDIWEIHVMIFDIIVSVIVIIVTLSSLMVPHHVWS